MYKLFIFLSAKLAFSNSNKIINAFFSCHRFTMQATENCILWGRLSYHHPSSIQPSLISPPTLSQDRKGPCCNQVTRKPEQHEAITFSPSVKGPEVDFWTKTTPSPLHILHFKLWPEEVPVYQFRSSLPVSSLPVYQSPVYQFTSLPVSSLPVYQSPVYQFRLVFTVRLML